MKRIVRYFFEGLIFVVPVAITIYVIYKAFIIVDNWLPLPWAGAGFLVILDRNHIDRLPRFKFLNAKLASIS